ncbi:MAG TPA: MBL fold metallo-hydrolase [Azospira sp.]|nr:MBL fold metallo-hydrolase [Azospira sp.]
MAPPKHAAPPVRLPDSLLVLERGWLSSNNILCIEDEEAALVDSGYVSHAAQTLALVERALDGRRLTRLLNTHSHSDHIGGNAALKHATGCQVIVPAGIAAVIAEWDEEALLLSPLGQQGARFQHDATVAAGDSLTLGGLDWQALAVPGHDMDALAYFNPEEGILISGDALWQDGFGVIFAELLGGDGLQITRNTLDMLARLPLKTVIPGHGAPFGDVAESLERAYSRLSGFEQSLERLARHALKVMLVFYLLEKRRVKQAELPGLIASLSFARSVAARHLGLDEEETAAWLAADLVKSGVLKQEDGWLVAA